MSVSPSGQNRRLLRFPAVFLLLLGLLVGVHTIDPLAAQDTPAATYTFDLPSENADRALKRFSEQSGLEVLFPTRIARRVRTQAVKGDYAPKEALSRMLEGSGLVLVEDQKAKAFSIRQEDPPKNGRRAAPPLTRDRPMIPNFPTPNEPPL